MGREKHNARRREIKPRRISMEHLQSRQLFAADVALLDGALTISGTAGDDVAQIYADESTITVDVAQRDAAGGLVDPQTIEFASADVSRIMFDGAAGDDTLVNDTDLPMIARGGAGDDVLMGGEGDDVIATGDGDDVVFGGGGTDLVLGGGGNDFHMPSQSDVVTDSEAESESTDSDNSLDVEPTEPAEGNVENSVSDVGSVIDDFMPTEPETEEELAPAGPEGHDDTCEKDEVDVEPDPVSPPLDDTELSIDESSNPVAEDTSADSEDIAEPEVGSEIECEVPKPETQTDGDSGVEKDNVSGDSMMPEDLEVTIEDEPGGDEPEVDQEFPVESELPEAEPEASELDNEGGQQGPIEHAGSDAECGNDDISLELELTAESSVDTEPAEPSSETPQPEVLVEHSDIPSQTEASFEEPGAEQSDLAVEPEFPEDATEMSKVECEDPYITPEPEVPEELPIDVQSAEPEVLVDLTGPPSQPEESVDDTDPCPRPRRGQGPGRPGRWFSPSATISVGAGHDIIFGGAGDDFVFGDGGDDTLFGDSGPLGADLMKTLIDGRLGRFLR